MSHVNQGFESSIRNMDVRVHGALKLGEIIQING